MTKSEKVYNITYIYNILESEMIYSMINNAARSLLCEQFIANNTIDPELYDRYVVKEDLETLTVQVLWLVLLISVTYTDMW